MQRLKVGLEGLMQALLEGGKVMDEYGLCGCNQEDGIGVLLLLLDGKNWMFNLPLNGTPAHLSFCIEVGCAPGG